MQAANLLPRDTGGGRVNHLLNICNINGAEVEPVPDSGYKVSF